MAGFLQTLNEYTPWGQAAMLRELNALNDSNKAGIAQLGQSLDATQAGIDPLNQSISELQSTNANNRILAGDVRSQINTFNNMLNPGKSAFPWVPPAAAASYSSSPASGGAAFNPLSYTALGQKMAGSGDGTGVSFNPANFATAPSYLTAGMDMSSTPSSSVPLTNEGAQNRNQQGKSDMNALMEAHKAVQSLYEPMGGTAIGGNENIRVKTDVYGRPYTTVRMTPTDEMGRSQKQETLSFGISDEAKKQAAGINEQAKAKEAAARSTQASMRVGDIKAQRQAMGFDPETAEFDPSQAAESGIDVQSGKFMKGVAQRKADQRGQEGNQLAQNYYNAASQGIGSGRVAMGKYGYAQTSNAPTTLEASTFLQREGKKRGMNSL